METFLPSLPLQRPVAMFVNKVRYAASWPSELPTLKQEDGALERSSFNVIRCMQQASFLAGVGVGSNYIHETLELRINLTRGTELIRLGTVSLVINGDEEGEVRMSLPAKPAALNPKKIKKKKNRRRNKYGYFSNDPTRRYFLDENSTLKVGIQVIPEETVRFAQEKEKAKKENELKQILQKDDIKELLRQMGNDNLRRAERTTPKNVRAEPASKPARDFYQNNIMAGNTKSLFPNIFCGVMPAFCAAGHSAPHHDPQDVPMVIHADNDLDHLAITSIISSVSESSDGSFHDHEE
mmetsp:Transcript_10332/g.18866  ORF Transcript_10332/g.18866 Transcript_10332/m.18866 type:complete len:295 (+) Transcript_10332:1-885(+)